MSIASNVGRPVVGAVAGMGWAPQPTAVAWAASEASRRAVPLVLVHSYATLPYESGPAEHYLLRAGAQSELDDAVLQVRRAWPAVPVLPRLIQHRPDLALQEESGRAAVVVLGTRTHAVEATEARFGSVVGALITAAACPVVAVPAPPSRPAPEPRPVVVAVDGSAVSQPAVAFAFDAAARRRAPLAVVHCWPAEPGNAARAAARFEHRVLLSEVLAGFAERYPDVPVTDGGCEGEPTAELVRWSRRAGLLVVGSHGRDRWETAVWGSVSRALVRDAACPVAVVRPVAAA